MTNIVPVKLPENMSTGKLTPNVLRPSKLASLGTRKGSKGLLIV